MRHSSASACVAWLANACQPTVTPATEGDLWPYRRRIEIVLAAVKSGVFQAI